MLINVLDYPDAATAIGAANDGDRIYFPGVRTYDAPVAGWQITKSLELFGDGHGASGSVLRSVAGAMEAVFVLDPGNNGELPHIYVHDLVITSPTPNTRIGAQGIRFKGESGKKLSELRLERVSISWLGDVGLQLHGTNSGAGAVVGVGIFDCEISDCGQQGVSMSSAWAVQCVRTTFRSNQFQGLRIRGHEISLYCCVFEDNCLAGGDAQLSAYDDSIVPAEMQLFRADACVFRRSTASQPLVGCRLRQFEGGVCIGGCAFEQPAGSLLGIGIEFAEGAAGDVRGAPVILPNRFKNVAKALAFSGGTSELGGLTLLPQFCDPSTSQIQLPSRPNDAPFGLAAANTPSVNGPAGLLIPAYEIDPASNMQLGMLAYNNSTDPVAGKHLRVVRTNSDPNGPPLVWKNILAP